MVFEHTDYRAFLKRVLAEKIGRNPAYSLRALSAQVGMSHSALSQVLSGKKNLSIDSATRVARHLKLSEKEADYFSLLVQVGLAKSPSAKETLLQRAKVLNPKREIHDLSVEHFRVIADWYHLAIRNLLEVPGVEHTPRALAKRLGITQIEADAALDRLLRLGMIEKDPANPLRYRKTQDYVLAQSRVPNEALRQFHKQMMEKAIESLETQAPSEKFVGTETLAISREFLPEAADLAEQFFSRMIELSKRATKKKTDVFHVAVQIFSLTPERKESR